MSHPMPGAGLARSEPRPSQYVFPNNKLSFINKPLPTTASSNKYCVKCAISARKCCWVRSRESANGRAKNFPKQPYLSAIRFYGFVPEDVFEGLRSLLDLRNSSARQTKAITRLKRYAGLESGYEPITQLAEARLRDRFENQHLIGAYIEDVNQGLNNTEQFITGIADLFKTAKLTGREEAQEKLVREHDIVTLPARPAGIRLASEAESAAVPAPHFLPPRLLGDTGEDGEIT